MGIDPLPTIRLAPRPWLFVKRSKPTISLGEQDKPDATHIHVRANEDDVPIYGTALMASESSGVEQKPYGCDNQVTVLVDSGTPLKIFTAEVSLLDSSTGGSFTRLCQ